MLDRLDADSERFLRPSSTGEIAVVLFETRVTKELAARLAGLLCGGKTFRRVCLIGADRAGRRRLKRALSGRASFACAFLDDTEQAKQWLLP